MASMLSAENGRPTALHSGKWESLNLVIPEIFCRESRLPFLRMDPRRLLAGMTEANGPSRHLCYLCPVTAKMDPR
jgi:hypothetical protein